MPIVADAGVAIRGDFSKFSGDLKKAETQTKGVGSRLKGALSPSVLFGGLAGGLAAASVISFLGDAAQAAQQDEASIALLTTAIRENEDSWDGNTDAIEATLKARMKLGFSDDEQRSSLGALVAVTKDHNVALDLQRTAMDLARLKGIDLATATGILGKVYGGNLGILGRYGIQLREGATATEAIAEIQKRAAGQAEAFANTSAGAAAAAGIAFGELQEQIGYKLLPILRDLSEWALNEGIPALENLVTTIGDLADPEIRGESDIAKWADDIEHFFKGVGDSAFLVNDIIWNRRERISAAADAIGMDYFELSERVREIDADMGDAALAQFVASMKKGEGELAHEARVLGAGFKDGLIAIAPDVADGAEEGLVEPVEEMSDRAVEQATNAARALTAAYAGELAAGAGDVQSGWEALLSGAKDEQTKAQRIASISAKLTSQELTDALRSEDPYLRAQAIAYRGTLEDELEKLSANAIYRAYLTGTSVATAIRDNQADAANAAQGLRRGVIAALTFNAYEIGQTGGETWARGVAAGIANEEWRVSQKVDDILDYLLLAGSPPFTKAKEAAEGVAKTYMSTLSKGLQDSRLGALAGNLLPSSSSASFGFGMASQTTGTAGRAITVIVKDAGVAASVGDIARGLREFEDTGMLP